MRSVSTMSMPMPRTDDWGLSAWPRPRMISGFWGVGSGPAIALHERQHLANGLVQPDEDRAADDAMAGVQHFEVRHDEDAGRVLVVQPMASVDAQAKLV